MKKKNIYQIVAYCPFDHEHNNINVFIRFQKFYGIVNSYDELMVNLFKLNNIFYFRKKLKYEIDSNAKNIIELKYDSKYILDFNNDCSKNNVTEEKFSQLYNFKIKDDNCYFAFIQSYTFLKHCIEEKKYDLLYNIFENFTKILIISNDELEKTLMSTNLLRNLHLLYF